MNRVVKTVTVASLTAVVAVLAIFTVWAQPDVSNIIVPMTNDDTDGDTHEGGTFRLPPTPYTEAHDEWIEWYRTVELNAIESQTRDAALMAHDFEVAFHPDPDSDGSFIVVALLAQRDRLDGTYAPTTNERLMHDWVIQEHSPPNTISEIDDKLLDLVGSVDNLHYAEDLYDTMTSVANLGYVPNDLRDQDWEYWTWEGHIAACDLLFDDCDPVQLRLDLAENRELTEEELERLEGELGKQENSDAVDIVDHVVPVAHAEELLTTVKKDNNAYLNVWADTCTHKHTIGCTFTDFNSGIGWNYVSESSTNHRDSHGDSPHTSSTIHFIVSVSAINSPGALSQYVYVYDKFTLPSTSTPVTDTGTIGASVRDSWNPSGQDHTFGASGKTYASVTYN